MKRTVYVSFDVYDTLICRLLPPEGIYEIMEEKRKAKGKAVQSFAGKRVEAEEELKKTGNTYTLKDIYNAAPFSGLSVETKQELMCLEEELELSNSVSRLGGKRLYESCVGKCHIVCISDMYFSRKFMEEMLNRNGYFPEKVYVSSEVGKSKREGDLYQHVRNDLQAGRWEILHTGDAVRSDVLHAFRNCFRARWLWRRKEEGPSDDWLYNIGFRIIGPVIFEFCRWIHGQAEKRQLLFLAREGEFFRKCYDMMYPDNGAQTLYLSRKAVVQGTAWLLLQKCSAEEYCQIVRVDRQEKISEILARIGIDVGKYKERLAAVGLTPESPGSSRLATFFQENRNEMLEDLKWQGCLFRSYIEAYIEKDIVLVDIGWKGRMQDLLQRYLRLSGIQRSMEGLYFGVKDNRNKKGFLFERDDKRCHDILCFSGLLEILTMPEHGSMIGLREESGKAVPVFAELEFSKESMERIMQVQRGILDLVQHCCPMLPGQCFPKEVVAEELVRFGCHPSKEAVRELGGLELYENGKVHLLAEKIPLYCAGKLAEGFIYSKWKSGFMKRTFRFDLPYEIFINWLRKRVGGV